MKKKYFILPILTILISSCNLDIPVKLSEEYLNDMIAGHFPLEFSIPNKKFEIPAPEIALSNDRIIMSSRLIVQSETADKKATETALSEVIISSGIRYNRQNKTFYLSDAQIEKLEISNFNTVKKTAITKIINEAIKSYLEEIPIYTLKENEFKQNMARYLLKKVKTEDETLVLILGFGK